VWPSLRARDVGMVVHAGAHGLDITAPKESSRGAEVRTADFDSLVTGTGWGTFSQTVRNAACASAFRWRPASWPAVVSNWARGVRPGAKSSVSIGTKTLGTTDNEAEPRNHCFAEEVELGEGIISDGFLSCQWTRRATARLPASSDYVITPQGIDVFGMPGVVRAQRKLASAKTRFPHSICHL